MSPVPPSALVETCLSVADLPRARDFYQKLFGYQVMNSDARFCAFNVGVGQVLLLFLRGSDPHGSVLSFGTIPPHGTSGAAHVGFGVPAESLAAWRNRLTEHGVAVESTFAWPSGGTSIYFRDPDGNLLEFLTPGVWPNY